MKLLIVRHWETYDNLEGLLTWQKKVNLTEKWKQQAQQLSKKLDKFQFDIIYCSTFQRAKDTIAPYLENNSIKIIYTDDILEFDLWTYNWAKPEDAKDERAKWLKDKVGWWESLVDLYNRANSFLKKIKIEHKDDTALLVWHNAINRNIIWIIKWYSIEKINIKKERYENTSVLEFNIV